MEAWRRCWREGYVPVLSTRSLEVLYEALVKDDPALIQGATTSPPPLQAIENWPVEAACALGYCGWKGENLESVGKVEEFFAYKCFEIDQLLNEPAGCRWFLNFYDETPREEMRKLLLEEVKLALAQRTAMESKQEGEKSSGIKSAG